jgi:hypothetical protein
MKTKTFTQFLLILITSVLAMVCQQVNAIGYQRINLDDYADNDTIAYCSEGDSLEIIAPKDAKHYLWFKNDHTDTLWTEKLILPSTYKGIIHIQGSNFSGLSFTLLPFKAEIVKVQDVTCGGNALLQVVSNYSGKGDLMYEWTPITGLNNAKISNPSVNILKDETYEVKVVTPNGCQTTEKIELSLKPMDIPSICMASVDSTGKTLLMWEKPLTTSIDSFYIYKESNRIDEYKKIGAKGFNENSIFVDVTSDSRIQSEKYKISIVDKCGIETEKSLFHKTVHLSINKGIGNVWNLIWQPYVGFVVPTYNIYRGTNKNDLKIIASISGANTQFSDYSAPEGYVYYQIEIEKEDGCLIDMTSEPSFKSTVVLKSRSNIATNNIELAVRKISDINEFNVYPNPVIDELNIEYMGDINGSTVEILDLNGKLIQKHMLTSNKFIVNTKEMNAGIYTILIKTQHKTLKQKLVKF